ncbi:unnamed protein product [Nezara viridula]|uniref:Uncharacterized protein n=1 Tax=Nezara viridula TaxID=85310 RepID=A0A9P0MUZ7_NEZVI|nr:unnamed protein product [Nezara viridula]
MLIHLKDLEVYKQQWAASMAVIDIPAVSWAMELNFRAGPILSLTSPGFQRAISDQPTCSLTRQRMIASIL